MRRLTAMAMMAASLLVAQGAQAKVKVVATLSDLGAIAREVGGDQVEVSVLAAPTEDPHFVDAKPNKVLRLARADLLVLNGLELEVGWLPVLLTGSRNGKVQRGAPGYLDASTLVSVLDAPAGKIDRSMGDIHPGGNPHYLKDPRNAAKVADGIASRLGQLDPAHAGDYRARAQAFDRMMAERIAGWAAKLAPFRGTPLVTYHRSWGYFTGWAGLQEVGYVEPKPGLPPSTGHVAQLFGVMRAKKAKLILAEEWYSPATSELLASRTGAKLVRVPGMPGLEQRYPDYFDGLVDRVVQGLGGN